MRRQQPKKSRFGESNDSWAVVVSLLILLILLILFSGSGLIIRTSGWLDPIIQDRTNLNIKLMRIAHKQPK